MKTLIIYFSSSTPLESEVTRFSYSTAQNFKLKKINVLKGSFLPAIVDNIRLGGHNKRHVYMKVIQIKPTLNIHMFH